MSVVIMYICIALKREKRKVLKRKRVKNKDESTLYTYHKANVFSFDF